MIKLMTLCAAAALTVTSFANNEEGTTRYKVDVAASAITWHATRVTGEHTGTVGLLNGYMSVEDGHLIAANVIANMETIACTNLQGEWDDKLIGHLMSEDFFHVDEHKTSAFSLRELKATPDGNVTHSVTGNFTIRGITQSVTFPAIVTEEDGTLSIQGEVMLDRSQFDVKYGSGSFFDNLGDNLIHDNFTVGFNLVAAAQ
jgi:polyisoprenoid-binding protein YceI